MIAQKHELRKRTRFPDGVDKRRFRVSFAELRVFVKKINTPKGPVQSWCYQNYRMLRPGMEFRFSHSEWSDSLVYVSTIFSSQHWLFLLLRDTVMGGQLQCPFCGIKLNTV